MSYNTTALTVASSNVRIFYDMNEPETIAKSLPLTQKLKRYELSQWVTIDTNNNTRLNDLVNQTRQDYKFVFDLPENAEYMTAIDLYIKLPGLTKQNGTFARYCDRVALAIISDITLYNKKDGSIFSKFDSHLLNILTQLEPAKTDFQKHLIGQVDNYNQMTTDQDLFPSTDNYEYYIQIPFYFNRSKTKAFPLFLFEPKQLELRVTLKTLDQLIVFDGTIPPVKESVPVQLKAHFQVTSTRKSENERRIKSVDLNYFTFDFQRIICPEIVSNVIDIDLGSFDMTHVIYICCFTRNSQNTFDYFNYSKNGNPIVSSIELKYQGQVLMQTTPEFIVRARDSIGSLEYIYPIEINRFRTEIDLQQVPEYGGLWFKNVQNSTITLVFSPNISESDNVSVQVYGKRINYFHNAAQPGTSPEYMMLYN
jgi:hypothetical protein